MDVTPNHDMEFLPKVYSLPKNDLKNLILLLEDELYNLTKNEPKLPEIELLRMRAYTLKTEIDKKKHWNLIINR
jgi:hypothetical protein